MADSFKGRRPASTQGTRRPDHGGVSTQRGGLTSPSAISSSSDDEEGGAPLYAGLPNIGNRNASGNASGNAIYAPPHLRQSQDSSLGQDLGGNALRTATRFQLGSTPDDSNVFEAANARAINSDPITTDMGATIVRSERSDEATPCDDNMLSQASSYSTGRNRQITSGALFDSPIHRPYRGTSPPLIAALALRTTPTESSNRHQIGGIDAQVYYSPGACVFVANLPEGVDDTRLEAEVTRQFSHYGTVFVKIRRDARNMPFAFCQFTDEADAQQALFDGRGRIIYGRACRTERVRANRTYIMYRTDGDDLEEEDARQGLYDAGFLHLEKCVQLPTEIQNKQGLSRAVLVKLEKFDPTKELHQAFKNHHEFRVITYDEHKNAQGPKPDPAMVWLNRYEVDRRSIFIGNLPNYVEDLSDQLRQLLDEVGDVVNLQLITRESRTGGDPHIFGFAEFTRPDMAALAVDRLGGRTLWGRNVRIERKASRDVPSRQHQRLTPSARARLEYQSPNHRQFEHHDNSLNSPETPLHYNTRDTLPVYQSPARQSPAYQSNTNTPMPATLGWSNSYGHQDWSSPPPYYTTSPYANLPGSAEYQAATPQMPTPFASQAMATPYGLFPASNYQWMSPYMTDLNLAPLAWAQAYGHFPTNAGGSGEEEGPDTPTRNRDRGDDGARQGNDEA
ncbi:hypothetical protein BKA67DRAFT_660579 [Truncatella angustata]|uniref:RRM domain-containing protein n=1 Tax=Truncatella angustata TaxID=152316 RepID=A0A9P8UGV8_9PEZI|nr:uncharacterized protein BKA67DRAFT_660579 [Truncatella angustata]KAH6651792.1 hypothetical protein BKA67DRAFT_660579 [Truncatella angustata]KAH8196327.1 hypothetical protein TruAng_009505 [Truncatella angustata]